MFGCGWVQEHGGDDERLVAIACAAERVLGTPREILGTPPMCKD
jgi:hypothetical protein